MKPPYILHFKTKLFESFHHFSNIHRTKSKFVMSKEVNAAETLYEYKLQKKRFYFIFANLSLSLLVSG